MKVRILIILAALISATVYSYAWDDKFIGEVYEETGLRYPVVVTSFGDYDLNGKTYYIVSGIEGVDSDDLEFLEYSKSLKMNMEIRGAILTQDKENADLCVIFDYGISDESYSVVVPIPIWGPSGNATITAQYNNSINIYQQQQVVGYHDSQRSVSKFKHYANVFAFDNKKRDEAKMLWKVSITNEYPEEGTKFRHSIPIMLYTALSNFGKSGDKVEVFFNSRDYIFNAWKNGDFIKPEKKFEITCSSDDKDFKVIMVETKENETIVLVSKYMNCYRKPFIIPSDTQLMIGNDIFAPNYIEGCALDKKIKYNKSTLGAWGTYHYIKFHFPLKLDLSETITLLDPKTIGKKPMEGRLKCQFKVN